MFHIIGMNLSLALFGGNVSMVLSEIDGIRSDRHLCAAAGISTNFFYTAAAILLMMESHAIFKATTSGIIGGKTRVGLWATIKFFKGVEWGQCLGFSQGAGGGKTPKSVT